MGRKQKASKRRIRQWAIATTLATSDQTWRDISFAEYSTHARLWKMRAISGEDFSVTPLEVSWGFFAKIDGVLLRYVG